MLLIKSLKKKGVPTLSQEKGNALIGRGISALISYVCGEGYSEEDAIDVTERFMRHYTNFWKEGTRVFEGIPEGLKELNEKGMIFICFIE